MKLMLPLFSILITMQCSDRVPGQPAGSLYRDGGRSTVGVILCHGRGKHPDWKVVGPLRREIHRRLGYHTLSLQMPVIGGGWHDYASRFPEAFRRIEEGAEFLRKRGVRRVILAGHSMGARMAGAWLASANRNRPGIAGFIGMGMRNNGKSPLNCRINLKNIPVPVLDLYGDEDDKDSRHARERMGLRGPRYRQAAIRGAGHRFEGHEDEMAAAVIAWLEETLNRR